MAANPNSYKFGIFYVIVDILVNIGHIFPSVVVVYPLP